MKRIAFLGGGAVAVFSSYVAVLAIPAESLGAPQVLSIAFPGIVSGLVMIAYAAWEARNLAQARAEAGELSAQLARKEIEIGRLAAVDELTGLATRREFDDNLRLELARARRHGRELSLLLLEIDDLADLGEAFGRLGKGYLISEAAGVLRHGLRVNDIGCRFTSDRLAMLLPETGAAQALSVAGSVRRAVADHQFLDAVQHDGVRITVSQGIASLGPWVTKYTDLVRGAEQALGEARIAGFDQVAMYEPESERDESVGDDLERLAS